ncbi:hypothetical protein M427DRAFT_155752 [Gonapodya prolifera JEL478]|uniref:Uncharacterized protein n=1 Tax=Gonapodya prolifera (strain JEL478) TaxID=1344416 RepID=A0A139ADH3_GONPJ|nr:hypothetical protein M427DRAFT_155752 [Gonapodya prolifera JEL478]|eukprot:KXS14876.1 hypothetical protein M427DRAFT_155752 [Gonapodya prolifera JEL478]
MPPRLTGHLQQSHRLASNALAPFVAHRPSLPPFPLLTITTRHFHPTPARAQKPDIGRTKTTRVVFVSPTDLSVGSASAIVGSVAGYLLGGDFLSGIAGAILGSSLYWRALRPRFLRSSARHNVAHGRMLVGLAEEALGDLLQRPEQLDDETKEALELLKPWVDAEEGLKLPVVPALPAIGIPPGEAQSAGAPEAKVFAIVVLRPPNADGTVPPAPELDESTGTLQPLQPLDPATVAQTVFVLVFGTISRLDATANTTASGDLHELRLTKMVVRKGSLPKAALSEGFGMSNETIKAILASRRRSEHGVGAGAGEGQEVEGAQRVNHKALDVPVPAGRYVVRFSRDKI